MDNSQSVMDNKSNSQQDGIFGNQIRIDNAYRELYKTNI